METTQQYSTDFRPGAQEHLTAEHLEEFRQCEQLLDEWASQHKVLTDATEQREHQRAPWCSDRGAAQHASPSSSPAPTTPAAVATACEEPQDSDSTIDAWLRPRLREYSAQAQEHLYTNLTEEELTQVVQEAESMLHAHKPDDAPYQPAPGDFSIAFEELIKSNRTDPFTAYWIARSLVGSGPWFCTAQPDIGRLRKFLESEVDLLGQEARCCPAPNAARTNTTRSSNGTLKISIPS